MRRPPVQYQASPVVDDVSVHRLVAQFREVLPQYGYVHVTDVPDSFDPVMFCRQLGPLMLHHDGTLVAEVRPSTQTNSVYYPGSTKAFKPHTEAFDLVGLPPRYLALWCVHPAAGAGGQTTLADTRPWIEALPDEELARLKRVEYDWINPHGKGLGVAARHPILADHGGRWSSGSPVTTSCASTTIRWSSCRRSGRSCSKNSM